MGSRYLLWGLLVIVLSLGLTAPVQAKDFYVTFRSACVGGVVNSSQLFDTSPSINSGLRDKGRWVTSGGLDFSNTSYTAVISGFTGAGPYNVEFRLHNGDRYFYTITAPVVANSYDLTYNNSTNAVLLTDTENYPVLLEVDPSTGSNYSFFYQDVNTKAITTGPAGTSSTYNFTPADQNSVNGVYAHVTETVSGVTCRSQTNVIQVAKENVTVQVVGGKSVCDGDLNFDLEVIPYSTSFYYEWTVPGGVLVAGQTVDVNTHGTGTYSVSAYKNVTKNDLISTSDPVTVGAYSLSANINPSGTVTLCEGLTTNITGSSKHPNPAINLDYQWIRNGVNETLNSNGYDVSDARVVSEGGEFVFRVQEASNPLCYATSPPTNVELTIAADPMPVTGSSACEGSSISNIRLGNSQVGVTYRLMYNDGSGAVMVQEWMSTFDGENHTFDPVSDVGSYTVEATGCSGVVQMNGGPFVISALHNETLPVVLSGSGCEGASHTITVQGSEAGVSYQLFRGATAATLAITSTGGDLTFSGVTIAGDYTVRATRNTTCTVTLDQGVRIGVVPAAQTFSPSTACADTPFTLTLANSEAGVQYTIYNAANASLYSQNSGGGPLSFTVNQPEGTYTIVAQNDDGCTRDIGSFTLQAPPITTYTLETAATPACAVNGPHTISLSNSQPGFTYRLLRGATVVSSVVAPAAGGRLDLASTSVAGTYTVEVSNDGCMLPMPTSLTIVAQPSDIPVEAGDYCDGDDVEVRLNTSRNGAIYRLYRDGLLYASEVEVTGTGGAIVFADKFPPGTYTVGASFVSGDCERMMTGDVVVNALPNVEINPFSDHYCADAGTVTIGGRPQVGTNDWWVSGFTTNPTWFTETGSTATINVIDLLDTQLGASDRVGLTFNYHYQDPVTGCKASASELITFVDDQSDNLDFEYRMAATDPWSNFAGDLVTCQTVDDILLQALFLDSSSPTASGVFSTNAPAGSITNSGTGDEGAATFHPSVAGNGLWAVTYTYIDPASGCEADITYNIQVGTTLSLHGLNPVYCKSDASFSFYGDPGPGLMQVFYEDESDPAPREQTGNDSGHPFTVNPSDPAWLAGDYLVRYTHTVDGCENVIENTFSILEEVDASFTIENGPQYCTTGAAVELIPTQSGGTFSINSPGGVGVTPNGPNFFLYPDQLAPDEYELTYTIQTGSCSDSKSTTVIVVEPDQIDISNLQATYCQGVADFDIWVNNPTAITGAVYTFTATANAGGRAPIYLNVPGDLDGTGSGGTAKTNATSLKFSPSYVGPGTYYITYTFDNTANAGCISTITKEVRVLPVPGVDFGVHDPVAGTTHTTLEFCQNADPVYLKGDIFSHPSNPSVTGTGYFLGVGVDNEANGYAADDGYALFDPSVVTAGDDHTITYRYTHHNGCVSERTREFDILPAPIRQRVTPVNPNDGIFCEGEAGVTIGLLGTQPGVSYIYIRTELSYPDRK